MNNEWVLDSIDTKRDMVRVRNAHTGALRVFFVALLTDAYVQNNTITCLCEKGGWAIEITSGNRKRIQPGTEFIKLGATQDLNAHVQSAIPEFLKKS